ncbi:MAG: hypothetical protein OWT28_03985 [Firmicutes bacterium]|nr:hypothetical protein [Bacillota bacterium]
MSDLFNRPTVFTSAIVANKKRNGRLRTEGAGTESGRPLQEAAQGETALHKTSSDGDQTNRSPLPAARHQTRTIQRARVLAKTQAGGPSIPIQWETIAGYLRNHFLAKPVCVLTHSGRFSGTLAEVNRDAIVLATSQEERCELQFSHILSVGHLPPETIHR